MVVYIGTYTLESDSRGVYKCEFDADSGSLGNLHLAAEVENPSFLAAGADGKTLYAVCELPESSVESYSIGTDYTLKPVSRVATGGSDGCHLAVSERHHTLYTANYSDGSVMACEVGTDGNFANLPFTVHHSGSGPNLERQEGPHAHSVNIDPMSDTLLVADLGTDSIVAYDISGAPGSLEEIPGARGSAPPGSGPRHMAFSADGKMVYCLNELTSTVTQYEYEAGTRLTARKTAPGLPSDFRGTSTAAEIHIHPNGRFLYTSNRGHESIAVFGVDEKGDLSPLSHVPTGGENPRNFVMLANGRFLLAANQDTNNIVAFSVGDDGIPRATGVSLSVPAPVCLLPV